eukprot:5135044-Prymnesium_polylepis.1
MKIISGRLALVAQRVRFIFSVASRLTSEDSTRMGTTSTSLKRKASLRSRCNPFKFSICLMKTTLERIPASQANRAPPLRGEYAG